MLANIKLTEKTFQLYNTFEKIKDNKQILSKYMRFSFKNIYKPNFKKIMKINRIPIYKSQFNI